MALNKSLKEIDPEVAALVHDEEVRQWSGLELIASENFTSQAVLEALGTCFTNKYSEGLPGARYYGGNEVVDKVESLCQKRALAAFHLSPDEWGVNVQPYSGSTANFAAYTGLIQPHDRIMGLDLPAGGHLTHGFYTAKKKISATSVYFESLPYGLDAATGLIDYDKLQAQAKVFLPKLLICGASAYPRDFDYTRLRAIADSVGALLLCDMAHISGIVAAQKCNNPFAFCDVVTSTTHKSLRGPRAGMIFYRKALEAQINAAVFPGCQGGPHNNTIAALAVALKQADTPEFGTYVEQLLANSKAIAAALTKRGYTLQSGGTDNHLVLWNVRPQGLTGSKVEFVLDLAHITVNKNTINGDKSALSPGGVRLGSPALTSRGMTEADMEQVVEFLHRGVQICVAAMEKDAKMMKAFKAVCANDDDIKAQIAALKADVMAFASKFNMPGFSVEGFQIPQ